MKINPIALIHRIEMQKLIQQEMIKQQQIKYIKDRQSEILIQTKGANVDEKVWMNELKNLPNNVDLGHSPVSTIEINLLILESSPSWLCEIVCLSVKMLWKKIILPLVVGVKSKENFGVEEW